MATIKSYTDLEQSKKLAEILPLKSADMWYPGEDEDNIECGFDRVRQDLYTDYGEGHPCWSLAALLSVIPNYKLSSEHNYHTCTAATSFGKETVAWFDNPVDACYEMILKLNKLNLL